MSSIRFTGALGGTVDSGHDTRFALGESDLFAVADRTSDIAGAASIGFGALAGAAEFAIAEFATDDASGCETIRSCD